MIISTKKRDGHEIRLSPEKIARAIFLATSRAAREESNKADYETAEVLTERVVNLLNNTYQSTTPIVENMQDAIIKVLIEAGYARTSGAHILYRAERTRIRSMKTRLTKPIGEVTFVDSSNADIKREDANIGGNTAMGTVLQYEGAVLKEFCMGQLMNPQHVTLHENGDIHTHDMDFMNMGALTCCQINLEELFSGGLSTGHGHPREPQDITSYAALAAIVIQSNQNDQYSGRSISVFDFYLVKGITKTSRKEYINNLSKTLKLFINLDAGTRELFKAVEKEAGKTAVMIMDDSFLNSLNTMLKETFGLGEEQIELINKFAYKKVNVVTKRKTYQAMEASAHNLNIIHSCAGAQVPFSSINSGTDTTSEGKLIGENLMPVQEAGLGNGEASIFPILVFKVKEDINYNLEDPSYDLFKLTIRVSVKRLFPNLSSADAPFSKQYYEEEHPETEATYMGCRTYVVGNINGPEIATGRGNNSFISISLPRLGIEHGVAVSGDFNEAVFFNEPNEKIRIVIR